MRDLLSQSKGKKRVQKNRKPPISLVLGVAIGAFGFWASGVLGEFGRRSANILVSPSDLVSPGDFIVLQNAQQGPLSRAKLSGHVVATLLDVDSFSDTKLEGILSDQNSALWRLEDIHNASAIHDSLRGVFTHVVKSLEFGAMIESCG